MLNFAFLLLSLYLIGSEESFLIGIEERYLIIQPDSGFGNRIGAIAGAYALAKMTSRKLVLLWEREENHMPVLYEELFVAPMIPSIEDIPELDNLLNSNNFQLLRNKKRYSSYRHQEYNPTCTEKETLVTDPAMVIHIFVCTALIPKSINLR